MIGSGVIKIRKTKDGYVDATDELAEEKKAKTGDETKDELTDEIEDEIENEIDGEETEAEAADEVLFVFPEEDDEELAALSAEDAAALIKTRGRAETAGRKSGKAVRGGRSAA